MKAFGNLFLHLCKVDKSACNRQENNETNTRKRLCRHVSSVFKNLEHLEHMEPLEHVWNIWNLEHLIRMPISQMLQSYNVETVLMPEGKKHSVKRGIPRHVQ